MKFCIKKRLNNFTQMFVSVRPDDMYRMNYKFPQNSQSSHLQCKKIKT